MDLLIRWNRRINLVSPGSLGDVWRRHILDSAGTLANPFKAWPLAKGLAGSLQVDNGDHIWDLARLGWALHGGDAVATTVPIGGFENVASGNVLLWDKAKAAAFFDALAADQPVPQDLLTR